MKNAFEKIVATLSMHFLLCVLTKIANKYYFMHNDTPKILKLSKSNFNTIVLNIIVPAKTKLYLSLLRNKK